jgi:hypothetical protein
MAVFFGIMFATVFPEIKNHPNTLPNLRSFRWFWIVGMTLYAATLPIYALYAAAAAFATVKSNLGAAVRSAEAWAAAWKKAGRHIWLLVLLLLIVAGPLYLLLGAFLAVLAALGMVPQNGQPQTAMLSVIPFFVLLILGGSVYMIFAFLRYSLCFAVCVIEDLPASAALRRSAQLTRGAKGRIFVVLLVMYVATYALILACEMLVFVFAAIVGAMASLLHLNSHSPGLLFLVIPLAVILFGALFLVMVSLPYAGYSAALGVLYCDQRFRNEGALPALPAAEGPA